MSAAEFVTGDVYKLSSWDRLTRKKCSQALESVRDAQPALRDPDSEFRLPLMLARMGRHDGWAGEQSEISLDEHKRSKSASWSRSLLD